MGIEDRVGVVIPNFNNGTYLTDAVESAVAALGAPGNIVVVDDGSTEAGTSELLDSLEARGVRVVRQENAGVSVARNVGISMLTTPYVLPLDSDDLMDERAPRVIAEHLDADPESVFVAGGYRDLRPDGTRSDPVWPESVTRDGMRHRTFVSICTGFRRKDWETVGGFPAGVAVGEDWIFWMRLLRLRDRGLSVPHVFLTVRAHEGQTTRYIRDVRRVAVAQNMVLRENPDLVDAHRDELIDELCRQRQVLAEYRHAYQRMDRLKRRAKAFKGRLNGWRFAR
ncbi:glycosyltransferase [Micrococcus luteus]|uniref:glycosyltransferase family 2 protein n=1 Tax=Micrococcus sp. KRD153 TaxID=2729724 RepID=UPI0019D1DCB1|nr:glycosyltransferase [Micrococcus sp. KRD153]MCV7455666.1 glycosyltransferase [Micrococcus luteus]MCV7555587.1 glycosyltransferase [Micrococcus luteus]MDN5692186.1 glycosyltransferase [Micrococcaceae bacterium]